MRVSDIEKHCRAVVWLFQKRKAGAMDYIKKLQELASKPADADARILYTSKQSRDSFYWSTAWREMRARVKRRDGYECQACKQRGLVTTKRLVVHHIRPLEAAPGLALEPANLVTLCHACHEVVHGRGHATTSAKSDKFPEWW